MSLHANFTFYDYEIQLGGITVQGKLALIWIPNFSSHAIKNGAGFELTFFLLKYGKLIEFFALLESGHNFLKQFLPTTSRTLQIYHWSNFDYKFSLAYFIQFEKSCEYEKTNRYIENTCLFSFVLALYWVYC